MNLLNQSTLILVTILFNIFPLPAFPNSNTVEIVRGSSEQDNVTLKVRVVDDQRIPIRGLNPEDFKVKTILPDGTEEILRDIELIRPEKAKPDPTYLVILLDMSGSMKHKDDSGVKKLRGAVDGVQVFLEAIEAQNLPVEIALVPFGEGCDNNYRVSQEIIKENLESSPYPETKSYLNNLAKVKVCASTNLYQPLTEAVEFLGNEERFQADSSEIVPRLGVILFTDGFDADPNRNREEKRFQELKNIIEEYSSKVTVHAMGYGESLSTVYNRATCDYNLSKERQTVNNLLEWCRISGQDIREFIVDEDRLQEIAQTTPGGISRFPRNAQEVIDSLNKFLTTLREYEITYQQPNAEKAGSYETQVIVNSETHGLVNLASNTKTIRFKNFSYQPLPWWVHLLFLIATIIIGKVGINQFKEWSEDLKQQAKRNLNS
ncbi:vWA domain-containing protein [Crocosphaera sp.]|uniref:vWA domain-containing protein n=1 Tax=Crocosphaera sp. TaxID=2729996 RepID=UPI002611E754|nr:vWA domain-containing protein [Crocosphaera sp.]MDJ0581076.1 vWA domain-containing protein [Crocosphaera sp.]